MGGPFYENNVIKLFLNFIEIYYYFKKFIYLFIIIYLKKYIICHDYIPDCI